ncbi:hypothetical protein RND81_03G222300 [Saponaria officinalis]|uniref:Uncharacterized protein n=1 Tax=Saponaria officinalis TaxID=3572 RepID=A0AAW1M9W2_SAPOF
MASEPKTEPNSTPLQLQLTSLPNLKSIQHYSGALTPLHTSASVPFSWEQVPGKPLPCLTLALASSSQPNDIKSLDLPPRLTKTPSPTTVLEGPYNALGRSILGSSSFRFLRKRQKSFDGELSLTGSRGSSPDRGLLNTSVVVDEKKDKGLFGNWRKKGGFKSETREGSLVISSFSDDGRGGGETVTVGRVRRKRKQSSSKQSQSHFWATIYGTFKQVMPTIRTK